MAEQLLLGTAERIIDTLGSPASRQIRRLFWGVEDELQSLKNTVSTIENVLLDAEEKQDAGNNAVKDWLGKLEDAIYDADDLLDAISAEALRRQIMTRDKKAKRVRIFFSKSNQLAYRLKMGHKIKAMRERLDVIIAAARDFHLKVRHVETPVGNRERDTHSFVREEAVIGREDDKRAVIHRLVDSNVEDNVSILPIVGIGGLGKTTLAKLIFNDEIIKKHFELKVWVCVSETFHVQTIVEKILESATTIKQPAVSMNTLVIHLQREINGKKYLLVLDDVWNEDHEKWSHLKEVLMMGGARGSRVLLTTRNESVARITGTVQSYSLGGLDKDASWSLFKQMAFEKRQETEENSNIVAIGWEILEKCSGVPLAIKTIGSSLRLKSESEWLSFKNDELSKISQRTNNFLPTLKLSYDQLPSHLKHCFAYCCLFRKDYKIARSTLIKYWIAQGFVKLSNQNRCLEDVGNEYFMDLLSRSFFQEAEIDEFGNVIQCKIHGLMHELAVQVAGSLSAPLDDRKRHIDEKTRHVSVGYDIDTSSITDLLSKASKTRTFLCLDGDYFGAEIDCKAIFSSFKLLRVLDMHLRNLDFVPSSIGKLKHLRHLDLSGNNNIEKLPDSITRLQNLETLGLSYCLKLRLLPRDIKKLVNLRHLEIDGCHALTCMPRGLGQLTNLQTLSKFVVHPGSDASRLTELNGLNNLRGELEIVNLRHGNGVASEYKVANLKKKQLHALLLRWSVRRDVNDLDVEDEMSLEGFQLPPNLKQLFLQNYGRSRLSSCLLSLTNLVRIELNGCWACQYLPPLSQLPSLKYLALSCMMAMEYISEGGDSNEFAPSSVLVPFFPSLEEISLQNCLNLKGWWRRDSSEEVNNDSHNSVEITEHRLLPSFPRLSTLEIKDCPMLTSMPMFPHLEKKLVLHNASSKPLQQTMMMNMAALQSPTSTATTSSSSTSLSKLKSLKLYSIVDLKTLPLQNLTSLEYLSIYNCLELELANDEDEMQGQGLTSLLFLSFNSLPKLVSLPLWLQHATTLQKVEIRDCESLTAIPEWIHNCKSLQVLEIQKCLTLASLPEGMRRLTSLQVLTIMNCPIVLQRCKRDTGEDWPKIAHIPKLNLW